jgi:diacylglycerol kinase family enzyme
VDEQSFVAEGVQCAIANSAQMGLSGGGLTLAQGVSVDDGWLDVIVITGAYFAALAEIAVSNLTQANWGGEVLHWRGRTITVTATPPQTVALGGEVIGPTPVTATILPAAVRVLVPNGSPLDKN